MADSEARRGEAPVFVGGAQRSGTHALAHLVAAHGAYWMVPRELVFHSIKGGLTDVVRGDTSVDSFVADLRGRWWKRHPSFDPSLTRGLHKTFERQELEAAVDGFVERFPDGAEVAGRGLLDDLIRPALEASGAEQWVEMTPQNAAAAPVLHDLFPSARFLHVVRDGRDVACSLHGLPWGPGDLRGALERWVRQLREADRGMRALPHGAGLVVRLEELVAGDRERSLEAILGLIGPAPDGEIRLFFDSRVTPQAAHLGRWRTELGRREQDWLTGLYEETLERLRAEGVRSLPATYRGGSFPPSDGGAADIDPWADGRAEDA